MPKSNFPKTPLCVYEQRSGRFYVLHADDIGEQRPPIATFYGYAGTGAGRNNPAYQRTRNIGPLPVGEYEIGRAFTHRRLGPVAMRLEPKPSTVMHGRSGFLIHGDNAVGDASEGCIVLPRAAREFIVRMGATVLRVVRGMPESFEAPALCNASVAA